jgi:hypothetical protein
MKAISIRSPWWWFILHGGKDIENRSWPTKFRGTVYVHASKWWRAEEVRADGEWCLDTAATMAPEDWPSIHNLQRLGGHIVGTVDIVDCVTQSDSPWFFGEYGFVLANPKPLALAFPYKGALGFFEVPNDLHQEKK